MPVVTVPDGAVSITVAGDFAVIQYVTWNTTYWVTLKDGVNFTVDFSTPAGPGDQSLGYLATFAPPPPATGTMTLAEYLAEVRRLLHDAGKDYWDDPELIIDINKAIRQRDLWSGGSRAYRPGVALTLGQDLYSLTTLFPTLTVLDVLNIWLIWGSRRMRLNNPAFTDLNDTARPWTGFQNVPFAWNRYGQDGVFIAPRPAVAYTADWDLAVLSTTFVNLGDVDPLTFPYTEPVPYYAAYLACINARRWDLADRFQGQFLKTMRDIEGSRVGELLTSVAGRAV